MNQLFYLGCRDRVQCRSRFIHKQNRRRYSHGTGYAQPLLLTTGQGKRRLFQLILHLIPQCGSFQGFLHPVADKLIVFHPIYPKPVGHILENAFRERVGTLKDHPYALAQLVHLHGLVVYISPVNQNLPLQTRAGNEVVHAVEQTEEGGLATAGRAYESHHRFLFNRHAYIFQCLKITIEKIYMFCIYLIHILNVLIIC